MVGSLRPWNADGPPCHRARRANPHCPFPLYRSGDLFANVTFGETDLEKTDKFGAANSHPAA